MKLYGNGGSINGWPIFTRAMGALAGVDNEVYCMPSGVEQRNVCKSNHGLADRQEKDQTYRILFADGYAIGAL